MNGTLVFEDSFEAAIEDGGWTHDHYIYPLEGGPMRVEQRGNVFAPPGWRAWAVWREDEYDLPEVRPTQVVDGHPLDPVRVRSGNRAMAWFASFRKHWGGLSFDATVPGGSLVRFTIWAHGWSNHNDPDRFACWQCGEGVTIPADPGWINCPQCGTALNRTVRPAFPHPHDPRWSEGVGYDVRALTWDDVPEEVTFVPQLDALGALGQKAGIDVTGNTDPRAASVQWSDWRFIYNGYAEPLSIEAVAPGTGPQQVTVFVAARAHWPYCHTDVYVDDASLTILEAPTEPAPDPPTEPALRGSLLGPHILKAAPGVADILAAKPRAVKLVGEWGLVTQCAPETLVIGRKHDSWSPEGCWATGKSPAVGAAEYMETQRATIQTNPLISYWEGPNEPAFSTPEGMAWYAQFEIERMYLMADIYRKCVIGNFSSGCPDIALWQHFLPALREGRHMDALIGLHEYSCPWMYWMTGNHQIDPTEDCRTMYGQLAGWTTLRYRLARDQWPPDCCIPIVITECGIDPLVSPRPPNTPQGTWKELRDWWIARGDPTYWEQLRWYEDELLNDPDVVAAFPFCWGATKGWEGFDIAGTGVAKAFVNWVSAHPATDAFRYEDYLLGEPEPPTPPVGECEARARVPYDRTTVLLPPNAGYEWYVHAAMGAAGRRMTIGASADDAGVGCGLGSRTVLAVNPQDWNNDLEAFFEQYYPGVDFQPVLAATPAELTLGLQEWSGNPPPLSQRDPRWADADMGEEPGGATMGAQGCLVTIYAWMLSTQTGSLITPPLLNDILRVDGVPFTSDNYLTNWDRAVKLFPSVWSESLKVDRSFTVSELRSLVEQGWRLALRRGTGDNTHFVGMDRINPDNTIRVLDPWYGEARVWTAGLVTGVRGARINGVAPQPPIPEEGVKVGYNDWPLGGGAGTATRWMIERGVRGAIRVQVYLGTDGQSIDYSAAQAAGIDVFLDIRHSWSTDKGGTGTLPPLADEAAFVRAAASTIINAKGLRGATISNEANNPREWPADRALTPADVVRVYNAIRAEVDGVVPMAPGAVDPFYGPGSDNREWHGVVWAGVSGAEFVDVHGYVRGPNPELCWDGTRFSNDPLRWQGLNYWLCCQTLLEALPEHYHSLPVLVSEFNHLWKTVEPDWGWVTDERAAAVVVEATERAQSWNTKGVNPVRWLCLYRWDGDEWVLKENATVQRVVAEQGGL